MLVYFDFLFIKNIYRILIWVYNMNFCSIKSFYSEIWMFIFNNGFYYIRCIVC